MWALAFIYGYNDERHLYWLEQAAIHGRWEAADRLAQYWQFRPNQLWQKGDLDKAIYWHKTAAYHGSRFSMKTLTDDYGTGYWAEKSERKDSYARAIYRYRKAG